MYEEGTTHFLAPPGGSNTFSIFSNTSVTFGSDSVGTPANAAFLGGFILNDDYRTVLPHYPNAGALGDREVALAYVDLHVCKGIKTKPAMAQERTATRSSLL